MSNEEIAACDDGARQNGAVFIASEARGVFSSVFCDFGDAWDVADVDGEPPVSCLVSAITQADPALVTTVDDARHGLEKGDVIIFSSCVGMTGINDTEFEVVSVPSPSTFEIKLDASKLEPYVSSGYATQKKMTKTIEHKSFGEALEEPGDFLFADFAKLSRPTTSHHGFKALRDFRADRDSEFPKSHDDANAVVNKARAALNATMSDDDASSELEDKALFALALGSRAEIAPMTSFLGGVVGQEALKACTAKFAPISQFFYFDAIETLPEAFFKAELATSGSRYAHYEYLFGAEITRALRSQTYFLVGAGAIGCEMLKNWALMGVGSDSEQDGITITDMDRIEKSNSSRQLLFRAADIGATRCNDVSSDDASSSSSSVSDDVERNHDVAVIGEPH